MKRGSVDPMIGRTLGGRYRLIQRLGSGGMSSVYLARHVVIDRVIAIKILRRSLASDPIQRDRFIREARAVNRINHQNIVEISDYRESDDGLLYLVMEYVRGKSLLEVMAGGPMSPLRAFAIAEQAASALARAHQMGVIHRDLKPENLLLVDRPDHPDFVKLLDFGIAKLLDQPALTGSQQIFGTPGYIAPEYIRSSNIDGRADLYSLGVILYEMVTGALPFDYEYPGDLLVKHVSEPPIRPSLRRPGLPAPVEEFVLRCLEKSPDQRFRDAFHFLEELRACRERLGSELEWGSLGAPGATPLPASALTPPATTTTAPPPSASEPASGERLPEPARRDDDDEARAEPTTLEAIEEPAERAGTEGADRRAIPLAPLDDLSIEIEIAAPMSEAALAAAARSESHGSGEYGLAGVRRWRERFEGLQRCLDDLVEREPPPGEIDHAMAFAARTMDELEELVAAVRSTQRAIETQSDRARDFRATVGRTMDELAGSVSHERGELERLAAQRVELEGRRALLRGERQTSEADALLWELAALDQALGEKATEHRAREAQVQELQRELDRRNAAIEEELSHLSRALDAGMDRVWPIATALRSPLERVEAYVRGAWTRLGD